MDRDFTISTTFALASRANRRPGHDLVRLIVMTAAALVTPAAMAGTGGPDAGGYRFIDSQEPGGPVYNFEDISGSGTPVVLTDDSRTGLIPIGFDFEFYGVEYSSLYIYSDCLLMFIDGPSDACCQGQPLPAVDDFNGLIAGWWEDINPAAGGTIHYQTLGSVPDRRFIVQFTATKLYGREDTITLQFKLFERDDTIEVHYQQTVTDSIFYSAGIENQTGTAGLQYYYGGASLNTPIAVKYFDKPVVSSIARAGASPTNADQVDFTVTFSEGVAGVDLADFASAGTVVGGGVDSVTPESASVYTVTVDTGSGEGTVRLDLLDDDSITAVATGDALGGIGDGNGDFSGESYVIDRTGPTVSSLTRLDANPTAADEVSFLLALDDSANGVDVTDFETSESGTLSDTSVIAVSPAFNNALDLRNNPESSGNSLNLGNDSGLQVTAFTIEAWVYYQNDGPETVLSKGAGNNSGDYIFQVNRSADGKLSLWAAGAWHDSTSAVAANTWTHVAVTYDGQDKRFYIDGSLDRTVPYSGAVAQTALNAYIGREGETCDCRHFDGLIDEVRLWDRARIDAEILSTRDTTLTGGEDGLIGYWRMDAFEDLGTGAAGANDVADSSANSNHGDALNTPELDTSLFDGLAPDYVVRVNTGSGNGDLGLTLRDDDSIVDAATNPLGGAGPNDYSAGQTYTLQRGPAELTTAAASDVTGTTATCGGEVTFEGTDGVSERGVCWSTDPSPTTDDDSQASGAGLGSFTADLAGLVPSTTYHFRAYAINGIGTSYGDELTFITLSPPTVTTAAISNIASETADCGGDVTTNGGADVTARGVCWSTAANPTTADSKTSDGAGTGSFTSVLTGLVHSTTYYVRAYATNSVGTAYGEQRSFATTAATITVCATDCDFTAIQAAINDAQTNTGDTIQVEDAEHTEPGISVEKSVTIQGHGVDQTILQAHAEEGLAGNRVFYVADEATVTLRDMTIRHGNVDALTANGGGVLNYGALTVIECAITGNHAVGDFGDAYGGGIASFGPIQIRDCTLSGNSAAWGGGMSLGDDGTILRSTIGNNQGEYAGGVYANSGTATFVNCTVSANASVGGDGGAGGVMVVNGGAVANLTNCTITANSSDSVAGAGGIRRHGGGVNLMNSIVAGNLCPGGSPDVGGTITSGGYNLIGDNSGAAASFPEGMPNGVNDWVGTSGSSIDPRMGELADNGGPTLTHALLPASQALDQIPDGINGMGVDPLDVDQRGQPRPALDDGDIGAFELQTNPPTMTAPVVTTAAVAEITGTTATCGGTVEREGGAPVTARGVCWSESANPTVADRWTEDGTRSGTFTSELTGLSPDTHYHVRAYATNTRGTSYGADVEFTTPVAIAVASPTVITADVSNVTTTTAVCGGNVAADGGAPVTTRGVCWSASANPTLADGRTTNGAGTGPFSSRIIDLLPETTYYVRAYASNSAGTAYGAQVELTTEAASQDDGDDDDTDDDPIDDAPDDDDTDDGSSQRPDLRVTIASPGGRAAIGDDLAFRIGVVNAGDATATDVTLTVPLPPDTEFVGAWWIPNSTAQAVPLDAYLEDGQIHIVLGDVVAGEELAIELVLRARSFGTITVQASAESNESDAPATTDAEAEVIVDDMYLEVVRRSAPMQACGLLGMTPMLMFLSMVAMKCRRLARRSQP